MLKSVKTVQRRVKKFLSQNKWSSLVTRGEIPEKMQANVHTYMVMKQIWKVARSGFRFSPKKSVGFVFFFRNDLKRNRNQNNYRSICRSISRKKQINRQYLERGSVCMCVWHRCAFYVTQRDTIIWCQVGFLQALRLLHHTRYRPKYATYILVRHRRAYNPHQITLLIKQLVATTTKNSY